MRESDKKMLAGIIDLGGIRPAGQPISPIYSKTEPVTGTRAERRAKMSDKRRKKKKFARPS